MFMFCQNYIVMFPYRVMLYRHVFFYIIFDVEILSRTLPRKLISINIIPLYKKKLFSPSITVCTQKRVGIDFTTKPLGIFKHIIRFKRWVLWLKTIKFIFTHTHSASSNRFLHFEYLHFLCNFYLFTQCGLVFIWLLICLKLHILIRVLDSHL